MKYAFLIYEDEALHQDFMEEYFAFNAEADAAGARLAGEGLQPSATATTVRVRNGETVVTDGPFAETKEQLGGFYVLECADLDEAISYAAKIPTSVTGSIEVRPLLDYEAFAAEQGG